MKDLFSKIGWTLLSIFLWFIVICLCIGILVDIVAAFKRDIIIFKNRKSNNYWSFIWWKTNYTLIKYS